MYEKNPIIVHKFALMKQTILLLATMLLLAGCWSAREKRLIADGDGLMRVLQVTHPQDSVVLRAISIEFQASMLGSPTYRKLCDRMLLTVQNPENEGVGIAAPQVGINRRLVAVQRFDKEGEPFEFYPNIRIVAVRGDSLAGREGCLSVPGLRGIVRRSQDIDIYYLNPLTLRDTLERVTGFTAVIFQHETDHLAGIFYTDKADSLFAE